MSAKKHGRHAHHPDAVYTDVWASMGFEGEAAERERVFAPFRVTTGLLSVAPDAIVMHCLPAHRGHEIDAEVIDGPSSVVFDQAENRLYAQQAVILQLMQRSRGMRAMPASRPVPGQVRLAIGS